MISANASNPELGGVPFNLKGANLGSDVLSVLDELGDNYFGEHDSNANDSNGQIVPAPQCKAATASQIKSGSFFTELKRRDVYKVAVAYAVVSWLLIQATSILLPTFDAPGWMMKAFVALLGLGFILSVIIAWVFEMTPEGIKRTADISLGEAPDVVRQLEARARQQFIRGYLFALIYAGLGDKAKAIDYLKREYLDQDNIDAPSIRVDPMLDLLHGDPQFETLSDKITEAIQYGASQLKPNGTHFPFQGNGA